MNKLPGWLKVSILVHLAAALLTVARPRAWPLVLTLIAVNHGLLLLASFWPRSRWLGPNLRRLPGRNGEVALTFDDGPDPEVTPQVLEILAARGARATFFCIAERAAAHPEIIRAIVAAGHRVENHSARHAGHFALFLPSAMARDIARAQQQLTALAGEPPRYFRAPVGMRNPAMGLILAAQGLRLVSWTRRGFDSISRDPERVLRRLIRNLAAGDILLLHDGGSARARDGTPVVLQVLPRLLDHIERAGLNAVLLAPPATLAASGINQA
jgi:peptidoglycan-N-acetylglucosamine deacetylase